MTKLSVLHSAGKTTGESLLVYGPPKTGKTKLVGDLARFYNLLWFDLENGIQTLISQLPAEFHDNVDVIQIPDSRSNPIAINTMMKVLSGNPCIICHEHGKVGCVECQKGSKSSQLVELRKLDKSWIVVVDSLSQLSDSSYAHIRGDISNKLEWSDYETWNQQLAMMLSQIQVASFNSAFISHENMVEMQDKSMRISAVGGTRNFSSRIAKFFGHVVYTEVAMGKFKVGSSPTYKLNVTAGTRTGQIIDPEKGVGLEVFFGSRSVPTDPVDSKTNGGAIQPAKLSTAVQTLQKLTINPQIVLKK